MRFLLSSLHTDEGAQPIGGVQTWNRTVANELERRGHDVVQAEPGAKPCGEFDVGIASNISRNTVPIEGGRCRFVIGVCHGIIPDERPIPDLVHRQAFVSEEAREFWRCPLGEVIRQPLDLDFWTPGNERRTLLARHSYRAEDALSRKLAAWMGLEYVHVRDMDAEGVRGVLRRSALVLATGRAAVEAMACGAPTVIYDHRREYQGPMIDDRWLGNAAKYNYSGRRPGAARPAPGLGELERAAHRARMAHRGTWRAWAKSFHNVRVIVDRLMEGIEC